MEDTSLEFDTFENIRRKLIEVFVCEGYARIDAERIALYVAQDVRDVHKLLKVLAHADSHTQAEIIEAVRTVVDDSVVLDKAKGVLIGIDQEGAEETKTIKASKRSEERRVGKACRSRW